MLTKVTAPLTRAERAEAYADLYEVPLADVYRRYGAVLLPRPAIGVPERREVARG